MKQLQIWIQKIPRWIKFGLISSIFSLALILVLAYLIKDEIILRPETRTEIVSFFGFGLVAFPNIFLICSGKIPFSSYFYYDRGNVINHPGLFDFIVTPFVWFVIGAYIGNKEINTKEAVMKILGVYFAGCVLLSVYIFAFQILKAIIT